MERSAIDQVNIFNKSVITQKENLIIATLSIRYDQVMSKTYNTESRSIKFW